MPRKRGPEMDQDELARRIAGIVDKVARGCSPKFAARAVGVNHVTWWRWRTRARDGEEPFATIMDSILTAEAQFICDVQEDMWANKQLLPHAWIQERRYPSEFSLVPAMRPPDDDGQADQSDEVRLAQLHERWVESGVDGTDSGPIDAEYEQIEDKGK